MHIDVLFSSEQASCQLSRHSCLFHQPLMKLEHCGICSRPISHLHQVYFAGYCFTFSNSCMVRKTCGTLRTFTSAREPLLILFRGRRQGRQPLNNTMYVLGYYQIYVCTVCIMMYNAYTDTIYADTRQCLLKPEA